MPVRYYKPQVQNDIDKAVTVELRDLLRSGKKGAIRAAIEFSKCFESAEKYGNPPGSQLSYDVAKMVAAQSVMLYCRATERHYLYMTRVLARGASEIRMLHIADNERAEEVRVGLVAHRHKSMGVSK